MKIYIAGQMSGIKNYNFKEFDKAKKELLKQKYEVISPADLARDYLKAMQVYNKNSKLTFNDISRTDFLTLDLLFLDRCDTIYMLKNWEKSIGATIEFQKAKAKKMKIIYQ